MTFVRLILERVRPILPAIVFSALLLLIWFLLTNPAHDLLLPSPESVWNAFTRQPRMIVLNALATFARVLLGLAFGGSVGIAVGLLFATNQEVAKAVHPLVEIVRPLPV